MRLLSWAVGNCGERFEAVQIAAMAKADNARVLLDNCAISFMRYALLQVATLIVRGLTLCYRRSMSQHERLETVSGRRGDGGTWIAWPNLSTARSQARRSGTGGMTAGPGALPWVPSVRPAPRSAKGPCPFKSWCRAA